MLYRSVKMALDDQDAGNGELNNDGTLGGKHGRCSFVTRGLQRERCKEVCVVHAICAVRNVGSVNGGADYSDRRRVMESAADALKGFGRMVVLAPKESSHVVEGH